MAIPGFAPYAVRNYGSVESHFHAIPNTDTIIVGYWDGTSIKVEKSVDSGVTWGAAVVVSTPGNSFGDIMLNEPFAYDRTTGRLHVMYGKQIDRSGVNGQLFHRYSDDLGATWSAEHTIDDGTAHAASNSFYRVGLAASNGHVSLFYAYISNSTFQTDGLWRTLSADGGATWSAIAKVYTGTVVQAGEPNMALGTDGTVLVSWYDDGVNNNQAGDLWVAVSRDHGVTWPASPTKLTTTTDYGRPRPATDNGQWWIIANKPWNSGSPNSDVYSLTSNDNAVSWGAPTLRAAHTTANLDHPDVVVVDKFVGIIWHDNVTAGAHGFIYSQDGGATFSSPVNPFPGNATVSDAPRLVATDNVLFASGYDQSAPGSIYARAAAFAIVPQAQVPTTDDFNRTENPLSQSGAWAQGSLVIGTTGNALKDVGGVAMRQSGAGTFDRSASYRPGATYAGNVEAWCAVDTWSTGGEINIGLGDPSGKNGYASKQQDGDFTPANMSIWRVSTGASTDIIPIVAAAAASGDAYCIQIIGTFVILWRKRSGVWVEFGRALDNTFRSNLKASLDIAGSTYAGPAADSFGVGALSAPQNVGAPSIAGTVGVGNTLTLTRGTWSFSPTRTAWQWQSSSDGGATWTNVAYATAPRFTVVDATLRYRVVETAKNSVGSTSANSNSLGPTPAGAVDYIDVADYIGATQRIAMVDLSAVGGSGKASKVVRLDDRPANAGSTVVGLVVTTTPVYSGSGSYTTPANATHALVSVEGNPVRVSENRGTTAVSSTAGVLLPVGGPYKIPVPATPSDLAFAATVAGSATLNISWRIAK